MPKNRTSVKTERGTKVIRPPSKFRIGNRKSGRSALLMTTAELLKELESTNNKRGHDKVRTVLRQRGVEFQPRAKCY